MKNYDVALIGVNGFLAKHQIAVFKNLKISWVGIGPRQPDLVNEKNFIRFDLLNPHAFSENLAPCHAEILIFNAAIKGRYEQGSELHRNQGLVSAPDFQKLSKDLKLTFSRLITLGSSEEYGPQKSPELISESDSLQPISSYGIWKKKLYENGLKYSQEKQLEFIHLRPFNVFGPGCDAKMFLRMLIETLLSNQSFKMTLGEQHRSFLSVETFKKTIFTLLKEKTWKNIHLSHALNISEPHYYKLCEVATLVKTLVGNGHIEFGALPYRNDEIWHQKPNLTQLEKLLGESYYTDFKSELNKLILACKENQDDIS